jgi:gamma-glutamylcyclotransferase
MDLAWADGSNGIEQMRERCENAKLKALKARLPDAARVFGGYSSRWDGAVASVVPLAGHDVLGSVVFLSQPELEARDLT